MGIREKLASMSPKQRQYLMLGGVGGGILALAMASASMLGNDKPATPTPVSASSGNQPTNIATPGTVSDPKDVWMADSSAQMRQMNDVIQGLKSQMATMNAQSGVSSAQSGVEPNSMTLNTVLPPFKPQPVVRQPDLPPLPPRDFTPPQESTMPVIKEPGISKFEVTPVTRAEPDQNEAVVGYIPAGTFVRVALLGGVDAPTGGQAQTNPHPVLMRAQDNAFLPNRYRFEIKECFLLASTYGDLSSERAIARLENLSCVRNDGQAVDVNVKGYIVGEDGKAGMRGRLISKQGQILANALLAGIGAGIGQAFQTAATTQAISPLGVTQTVQPGQMVQNGVSSGVGKALDRLSQYYIGLAEKLFPIIEVDAGRTVEVIFTKGFYLESNKRDAGGTYSDVWNRARAVMGDSIPMGEVNSKILNK